MRFARSTFPSGSPGLGLLLLRLLFGILFAAGGVDRLSSGRTVPSTAVIGVALIACAVLMLVGLLTRFAQVAGAVLELVAARDHLGFDAVRFFGEQPFIAALIVVCLALVGPGLYSVDSQLSKREELIMPPRRMTEGGGTDS